MFRRSKFIHRKQIRGCQGLGKGSDRKLLLMGIGVPFRGDEHVLELVVMVVCNLANMLPITELYNDQCYAL